MTQQVKMPEPVAWLRSDQLRKLGEPYSDSPLNEKSDSMMLYAKGTPQAAKQYGHDIAVITTDQAEAYAAAKVREALELAIDRVAFHGGPVDLEADIRSLMPGRNE